MDTRDTFEGAAVMFRDLVARVPADRLTEPGLGEWTVRDLIGHTLRAVLTVETYLVAGAEPAGTEPTLPTAGAYFHAGVAHAASAAVAERGREAGAALGGDVSAAVDAAMATALHLLADLAVFAGHGPDVAFALTGRRPLTDGFTLLG